MASDFTTAFLANASTSGHFSHRRSSKSGISRTRFRRVALPLRKESWRIGSALIVITAIMTAAALLEIWAWVPQSVR